MSLRALLLIESFLMASLNASVISCASFLTSSLFSSSARFCSASLALASAAFLGFFKSLRSCLFFSKFSCSVLVTSCILV